MSNFGAQKEALGLLEARGEGAGLQALDRAVKGAGVRLAAGRPVCPGKFLLFLQGDPAAVQAALAAARQGGSDLVLVASVCIANVHAAVWPALTGTGSCRADGGLAVVETHGAVAAVQAADAMAKQAAVELLRIRLASGLGGKGLIAIAGGVASLDAAIAAARRATADSLVDARVLPAPHPRVWELVL